MSTKLRRAVAMTAVALGVGGVAVTVGAVGAAHAEANYRLCYYGETTVPNGNGAEKPEDNTAVDYYIFKIRKDLTCPDMKESNPVNIETWASGTPGVAQLDTCENITSKLLTRGKTDAPAPGDLCPGMSRSDLYKVHIDRISQSGLTVNDVERDSYVYMKSVVKDESNFCKYEGC